MPEKYLWEYISERVADEARYILETGSTVRACAAYFGISKSTVHKDVTERLKDVDAELYAEVRKVLDKNLSERHIRGGIATRNKYLSGAVYKQKGKARMLGGAERVKSGGNDCAICNPACCKNA